MQLLVVLLSLLDQRTFQQKRERSLLSSLIHQNRPFAVRWLQQSKHLSTDGVCICGEMRHVSTPTAMKSNSDSKV